MVSGKECVHGHWLQELQRSASLQEAQTTNNRQLLAKYTQYAVTTVLKYAGTTGTPVHLIIVQIDQ